ncbi:MAG: type II toxin-antitoxin system Phd/YefM family antitoxin [Coriobacteriales bacterium]|jgi:prevent-host-death family protein|nr:type II toxin-antitoxin system Phd/YefM family antitoxin [Coriobacteriales bacterium]
MTSYPIAEAKSRFSEIVKAVEGGEEVLITRGGKKEEVAVIVPIGEWRKKNERRLGTLRGWGEIRFADDWQMTDEELLGHGPALSR